MTLRFIYLVVAMTAAALAQQPQVSPPAVPGDQTQAAAPALSPDDIRSNYVLGPGDQIVIRAYEVEELSDKPFQVESDGTITLPLIGSVKAAGLTVQELQGQIVERLKKYVRQPTVSISVAQFRAEPVFVVGAFKSPGIYPLQTHRTLFQLLTAIGGVQENSSHRIKLTRRLDSGPLPLPEARIDADGKTASVEINIAQMQQNISPADDIPLKPYDVLSVGRAEMVYITGDVGKVGPIEIGDRDSLSVLQVLAMSGGLGKDARPQNAVILRPVLNTARRAEIPLNVKRILAGEANDFPLMPNDVLYIPGGSRRSTLLRNTALIATPLIPTLLYLVLR